ncbi:T9SS-dependent choice-of-anchor J family protein [Flavobacterium litorale]|uniref:Choice-of-anchor J domain-containing protein n=1 Tax=Flavobacterium litorale TaxID=2856519 RepID=A0ABX8V4F4_9FLAO|nr:choice-of-anchor J domain-containing protein [Flavobacterium litorale]QYJ67709.1 choice-of-anchor J domain-containing protein [Flavobacterium litorale]
MKKQLLTGALVLGSLFTANAQVTLFEDSFESYDDFIIENIGDYSLIDGDMAVSYGVQDVEFTNATYVGSFIVFNPSQTTPALTDGWEPHTGNKMAVCFNALPDTNPSGPNDDWLISPQITLSSAGNMLSMWAKSVTDDFGLERFSVAISTTGTAVEDFTVISEGTFLEAPVEWTEYTYDLDVYANQQVYIAVHCTSNDAFALFVDDITVTADVASIEDNLLSQFTVYPNPATDVITITNAASTPIDSATITDINGRTVKTVTFSGVAETQINIADLAVGVYVLNIESSKGTATKKIVKN